VREESKIIPGKDFDRVEIFTGENSIYDYAIVDKDKSFLLKGYRVSVGFANRGKYQMIFVKKNGRRRAIYHFLFGDPPKGYMYDHINRNTRDNRRSNLRVCTPYLNVMNSSRVIDAVGVSFTGTGKKCEWHAYIKRDGKRKERYFQTRDEAIMQRKKWEDEYCMPDAIQKHTLKF
jgi:hypothetical protein